ncbi:hypothetical protein DRI50_08495 [candidate division KSB1 bacterium]|jgi:chemotaxis signal transduction protein|nr:MAG: hypothetical protein DRI50_08495 [candidate division KSB1 bacterium]
MQEETKVTVIRISKRLFAVEIKFIREVLPLPKVTRLPNVEPQFYGVFNLRGRIIPLVDIAPVLGLGKQKVEDDFFVVICEVNGKISGLLTEKVLDMRILESELLRIPENDIEENMLPFISSVYKKGKSEPIFVLDMTAVFESSELNKYRFE